MENSTSSKAVDQELKINLAALRKCDEFVLDILETSSQVALYKFDASKQEWEKTEVEGSLFLYRRSSLPKFSLMIMNRLNRENLNEHITKEMEFKVQKPFLLYKNSSMDILGIWFNNPDKCTKVGELIAGLYASPKPPPAPKTEARSSEKSIIEIFASAQRRYDEENKSSENCPVSSSPPPPPSSQARNVKASGSKTRSKSMSSVSPTEPSPSFLLPAAVENEENHPQAFHDPCIVKTSSPLRPPSFHSRSLPNSAKKTTQRQLFAQEPPPSLPSQLPTDKIPFPPFSSQNMSQVKAPSGKPGMTNQRSSSDISMAAALMSPLAFQSTKTQSRIAKDGPETTTMTKEQLQETLLYLLESDPEFLEKIHAAYLKNAAR